SEPALRSGPGRHSAVHRALADDPLRRAEAPGAHPRQFHHAVRAGAHHRRAFPRTRSAARIFVGRSDHGYAAVAADGNCRDSTYRNGVAPQATESGWREELVRCKADCDRIFAATAGDQEAHQVVRPDAGMALYGALPDASGARLLRLARSA